MSDEEPTAEEMRERADRARAKRAAERAARKADETKAEEKKDAKGKRKWWNWLIDAVLIGASAYLIWARFIRKDPQQDAPSPKPSTSVSASAFAPPTIALLAGTEVRAGAGPMFASIETVSTPSTFEKLEGPTAGWVKVKVPSGKIGWVPLEAIGSASLPPPPPPPSPSTSASAP
ncbi:MAG: SH3 domain-containing protein [Polyangiales bacterium]